jgi:VanZ family protein
MSHPARRAWWAAFAWGVVILCSVPVARTLQDLVSRTVGRQAYLMVVMATLALAVLAGAWFTWRALGSLLWRRLPWLLLSGGICAAYAWHLRHAPEEALHFIEYGVLGLLLFRALRHRLPDRGVFAAVLLVGTLFGVLDEFFQWFVPGRFWDLRDVFVNALAIVLALVALAGSVRPAELARRPTARSVRQLCALASGLLLALGLALSNTPPRVEALGHAVPPLSYLVDYGAVMTEYGHLHEVEGVGGLYSRLSWDELLEQDRTRAGEVARILDGYPGRDDYRIFLRDYPPFGDPYTHELRVHLFRRDRYLLRVANERFAGAETRRLATTAWAEDALLQTCCSATVAASGYALPASTWEPFEPLIERDGHYVSGVSSHLIVRFRAWQAWVLIGVLWVVLAVLATRPTSRRRPPSP